MYRRLLISTLIFAAILSCQRRPFEGPTGSAIFEVTIPGELTASKDSSLAATKVYVAAHREGHPIRSAELSISDGIATGRMDGLAAGDWSFSAYALNALADTVAFGSITVTVPQDADVTVEISLAPHLSRPDTPERVLRDLYYAMNHRDIDLYEMLLDEDYWFKELCVPDDELAMGWGKEVDVRLVRRVFQYFDVLEYSSADGQHWREFGSGTDLSDMGKTDVAFAEGDPDDHPGEVWEAFSRNVEILLYAKANDMGYMINQTFEFKLRRGRDGLWRIVRWTDYPWTP